LLPAAFAAAAPSHCCHRNRRKPGACFRLCRKSTITAGVSRDYFRQNKTRDAILGLVTGARELYPGFFTVKRLLVRERSGAGA